MRRALRWLTRALDALGRYEHDHHTGGPLPKGSIVLPRRTQNIDPTRHAGGKPKTP